MNKDELIRNDEISPYDLWERLLGGWKVIVGGLVLGIAGSVAAIFLIQPRYQAVAVIQVGQVGQVSQAAQVGEVGQLRVIGQPVEPPVQAVERMMVPAFQRRAAEALNDQAWLNALDRSAAGVSKELSLQIIKSTIGPEQVPLIELRVQGASPEAAKRKAEAAVAELVKVHGELASPALARMRADLEINREKLASAEQNLVTLNKLLEGAGVTDSRFTQLSYLASIRIQKESQTFTQRQLIMALETALDSPATQPARSIEAIFASDVPVFPNKPLFLVLGAVGGLLAGVLLVFGNGPRAKRKRIDGVDS